MGSGRLASGEVPRRRPAPAKMACMSWVLTILGIVALIVLHELGHFTVAKLVGMRVERFSLFFPPTLFKIKRGETEYAIGAIPAGGYVKITGMNPGQGFAVSLVTAGLVTTASLHSLPVSTTHVSVGSMLGMGAATRQARWRKVGEILLAWVSTVPCGALLAALAYLVVR